MLAVYPGKSNSDLFIHIERLEFKRKTQGRMKARALAPLAISLAWRLECSVSGRHERVGFHSESDVTFGAV